MPARKPKEIRLPRQTYEYVLQCQEELGRMMEEFASRSEVRPMSLEERWKFFRLWHRATLGFGAIEPLLSEMIPGSDAVSIDYYVFNVLIPGIKSITVGFTDGQQREAPAQELWKDVQKRLMSVIFGLALTQAARMSPERDEAGAALAHNITAGGSDRGE